MVRGIQKLQFQSLKMKGCSKRTSEDEKIKHCTIKLKTTPDIKREIKQLFDAIVVAFLTKISIFSILAVPSHISIV